MNKITPFLWFNDDAEDGQVWLCSGRSRQRRLARS